MKEKKKKEEGETKNNKGDVEEGGEQHLQQ